MKLISRFRDQKGNLVDFCGLYYAPLAFLTAVLRKTAGYRPKKPWISYRAIKQLEKLISPQWNVLEYGSSMSTLWLASRCNHVVTIEGNEFWYHKVANILKSRKILNVDLYIRDSGTYQIVDDIPDDHFDFALVDGWCRDKCMQTALRKVKQGGYIYLDNTDQFVNNPEGHTRLAESMLVYHLKEIGGQAKYFVDFSPASFFVSEGLLARI